MIARKIKSYIKQNNYQPGLVITNSPLFYAKVHKMFHKSLVIIGGLDKFESKNTEIAIQEVIENKTYKELKLPKSLIDNLNKSYVVFNSKLTQTIYNLHGVNPINSAFLFFNFAPYALKKDKAFNDRKYDICFYCF